MQVSEVCPHVATSADSVLCSSRLLGSAQVVIGDLPLSAGLHAVCGLQLQWSVDYASMSLIK